MSSELLPWFAQGARCGHIDGKARVGLYVQGEEETDCWEAANNGAPPGTVAERNAWAAGYRHGYRHGANGEPLEPQYQDAALPGPS